jgi:hypothetical protein
MRAGRGTLPVSSRLYQVKKLNRAKPAPLARNARVTVSASSDQSATPRPQRPVAGPGSPKRMQPQIRSFARPQRIIAGPAIEAEAQLARAA